jgi:hypothetical protein
MTTRCRFGLSLAAVVVGLVSACGSTTQLLNVWSDVQYEETIDRIMVVGMAQQPATRRSFEDELAARFELNQVKAFSSARLIPKDKELDEQTIRRAVKENGIEAVLITRLISIDKESNWVRGEPYVAPRTYYDHMYGYYFSAYEYVYEPGYLVNYTVVNLETNIYDVESEALIWSGVSESFDPRSTTEVIDTLGRAIMNDLKQTGFLPQ